MIKARRLGMRSRKSTGGRSRAATAPPRRRCHRHTPLLPCSASWRIQVPLLHTKCMMDALPRQWRRCWLAQHHWA